MERLKSDGIIGIQAFDSVFLWRCLKGVTENLSVNLSMTSAVLFSWMRAAQGQWVSSSSWQGEVSSPSELLNPVPVHKLTCCLVVACVLGMEWFAVSLALDHKSVLASSGASFCLAGTVKSWLITCGLHVF
jgi:hypothetical protein